MYLTPISAELYAELLGIYKDVPALFLQNKGYECIFKENLSPDERKAFERVNEILGAAIGGFNTFKNFRLGTKTGELQIRFEYNYNYKEPNPTFNGVGYLYADELLNGFRPDAQAS